MSRFSTSIIVSLSKDVTLDVAWTSERRLGRGFSIKSIFFVNSSLIEYIILVYTSNINLALYDLKSKKRIQRLRPNQTN